MRLPTSLFTSDLNLSQQQQQQNLPGHRARFVYDPQRGLEHCRATDLQTASRSRTAATPRRIAHQQTFCSRVSRAQDPSSSSTPPAITSAFDTLHVCFAPLARVLSVGLVEPCPRLSGNQGSGLLGAFLRAYLINYEAYGLHTITLNHDDGGAGRS